jgi:hypothetical protein
VRFEQFRRLLLQSLDQVHHWVCCCCCCFHFPRFFFAKL